MNEQPCGREQDLIAYLYNEASATEAADFRRHLLACPACRQEATAFGFVRGEVGTMREAAPILNRTFADTDFARAGKTDSSHTIAEPARSWQEARRALADLFRVSPRWLQASAALATVAFCALVSLPFLNADFRVQGVAGSTVAPVASSTAAAPVITLTQVELDDIIAREVARRTDFKRPETGATLIANASKTAGVDSTSNAQTVPANLQVGESPRRTNAAARSRPSARPRVVDRSDELPRLSDLLDGAD